MHRFPGKTKRIGRRGGLQALLSTRVETSPGRSSQASKWTPAEAFELARGLRNVFPGLALALRSKPGNLGTKLGHFLLEFRVLVGAAHPSCHVDYVMGLANNDRLKSESAEAMTQAEAEFNATDSWTSEPGMVTLHPVCQEEPYNPGRDVSINPN